MSQPSIIERRISYAFLLFLGYNTKRGIVIPGLDSHMAARVLGKEDATFTRLAHTEEALPGSDSLAGSQDELV